MKTILAAVDFSNVSDKVADTAAQIAKSFGCSLYLLHVEAPDPDFVGYGPGPQSVRDDIAEDIQEDRENTHTLRDRLIADGIEASALVIQGPTVQKILDEAKRLRADLIVVGSHGHGALYNLLLGSVSEGVIRGAPCPTLVVPSKGPAPHFDAGEGG